MNVFRALPAVVIYVFLSPPGVCGQGAGVEWDILNQEVMELYRTGNYNRSAVVAKKALAVAEENVGPDHPHVATTLENLAAACRATNREKEAAGLEQRAAAIRAIKR